MALFNSNTLKQLRKELKLSQQDVADYVGVSRGMVGHWERGTKPISDDMDVKIQELERETRQKLASLSQRNRECRDKLYQVREEYEEKKRELIEFNQLMRKGQDFTPSIMPSVDMVWLSSTLDPYKKEMFEREFLGIGVNSKLISDIDLTVDVEDMKYPTLQNGRYKIKIQGTDGKIHVEYGFLTKDTGSNMIPRLKVQFNPNKVKWDNKYLLDLMLYLGENPVMRKWDVCKDFINCSPSNAIMGLNASRNTTVYRSKKGYLTYQYGNMNENGTRIYDKTGELLENDKKDIGYKCTRIETRITLPKSIPLNGVDMLDIATNYPTMTLINEEFTKWQLGFDIDPMVKSCLLSIQRNDVTLDDFKLSNRRMYDKLKQLIENLKTDTITISQEEIKLASMRFRIQYCNVWSDRYGVTSIF